MLADFAALGRTRLNCFFFGRRPLPFGGSPLEAYSRTSGESNHHRQSVRVVKNDALPTEPRGHLTAKAAHMDRFPFFGSEAVWLAHSSGEWCFFLGYCYAAMHCRYFAETKTLWEHLNSSADIFQFGAVETMHI